MPRQRVIRPLALGDNDIAGPTFETHGAASSAMPKEITKLLRDLRPRWGGGGKPAVHTPAVVDSEELMLSWQLGAPTEGPGLPGAVRTQIPPLRPREDGRPEHSSNRQPRRRRCLEWAVLQSFNLQMIPWLHPA